MSFSDLTPGNQLEGADGTPIGNVGDALKVNLSSVGGYGTDDSSNNYKIETEDDKVYFSDSYQSIFSVSNYHGALLGIRIVVSTQNAAFKLTVDSKQVFEILIDNFDRVLRHNGNNNQDRGLGYDNNIFYFYPIVPINFTTSVLLEAKKTSGGTKYMSEQLYHIIKVAN